MGSCNSKSLESADEDVLFHHPIPKPLEKNISHPQSKEEPFEETHVQKQNKNENENSQSINSSLNNSDDERVSTPESVASQEINPNIMIINKDENKEENNYENDVKYSVSDTSTYAVDYNHVKIPISEVSDHIQVSDDHSGTKLMKIFDKITITTDDLSMWQLWSGGSFTNKDDAKSKLQTVVDYAEKNPSAPLIKTQLRVITKLIIGKGLKNADDYKHMLLLLASHGGVCNVMKDVAINNAYGMMTETLFDVIKLQTLEQQILKELRNYRHILVEKLHLYFKFNTNQHTVNGFYNEMADSVGLTKYIDPNMGRPYGKNAKIYKKGLDKRFFATLYTKENIIERIYMLINEKKISYQKIVQFFIDNKPNGVDKNVFLQQAIDIDTGKIGEEYVCYLFEKLKIFLIKGDDWKEIEKCWDDITE